MNYINLTPHHIKLNDGRVFPPSGTVARVYSGYTEIHDDACFVAYGEIENLPVDGEPNTRYIVSNIVLQAAREEYYVGSRQWIQHLVAPATGHPGVIRDNKGQISSVPCFLRA